MCLWVPRWRWAPYCFYLLLNNIFFVIPQAEGGSYAGIWGEESIFATLLNNLAYYTEQFKYFFSPWGGNWNFLPLDIKGSHIYFYPAGDDQHVFQEA